MTKSRINTFNTDYDLDEIMYNTILYTDIHVIHYIRECVCMYMYIYIYNKLHIYVYISFILSGSFLINVSPPLTLNLTTVSTVYINGESVEGEEQILPIKRCYVGKNCHELRRDCMMPVLSDALL